MKSNIEKVYSKLPQKKHNFKNQKVNLKSVQEIGEYLEIADEEFGILSGDKEEFDDAKSSINDLIVKMSAQFEYLEQSAKELETSLTQFSDNANELGLDPRQVDLYNVAKNKLSEYEATIQNKSEYVKDIL